MKNNFLSIENKINCHFFTTFDLIELETNGRLNNLPLTFHILFFVWYVFNSVFMSVFFGEKHKD